MSKAAKDVIQPMDEAVRAEAKGLLREARSAALATLSPDGHPSASLVGLATDIDGTPVILISGLAAHTANIAGDPRASLLISPGGKGDPLAHARITLLASAEKVERDSDFGRRVRRRFLARQPKASLYVDFPDFSFFALRLQRASLNGGFGRAYALAGRDLMIASPAIADLAAIEGRAVDHMNSDHADAATRYAKAFCKATEDGWTITAIDAAGLDLSLGDKLKRLEFDEPLQAAADLRPLLVRLYG